MGSRKETLAIGSVRFIIYILGFWFAIDVIDASATVSILVCVAVLFPAEYLVLQPFTRWVSRPRTSRDGPDPS